MLVWISVFVTSLGVLIGVLQVVMPIVVIWFAVYARGRIRRAEAEVEELRAHLGRIGLPVPDA